MRHTPLLLAVCALWACGPDRERPDPFGPNNPVLLSVQLVAPASNESVLAGVPIFVRVQGGERTERLTGVGFVARHGTVTLDSAKLTFPPALESLHSFTFQVPRDLPTNAQIDIYGYAYGLFGEVLRTNARTVIVIGCAPNCR